MWKSVGFVPRPGLDFFTQRLGALKMLKILYNVKKNLPTVLVPAPHAYGIGPSQHKLRGPVWRRNLYVWYTSLMKQAAT